MSIYYSSLIQGEIEYDVSINIDIKYSPAERSWNDPYGASEDYEIRSAAIAALSPANPGLLEFIKANDDILDDLLEGDREHLMKHAREEYYG